MDQAPSSAAIVVAMHHDNNPGIPSILSPPKTLPSLLRTLPADVFSRCHLPPRLPDRMPHIEDSSDEEDEGSRYEIWNSIQEGNMTMKKKKKDEARDQRLGEFNAWSSWNRSQWSGPETTFPPPYVHPLVRRSSSCLSEKSLEICTESLGSESGSDGLSSFLLLETGSETEQMHGKNEAFCPVAFGRADSKHDFHDNPAFHARSVIPRIKELSRAFPPPLPSLSSAADGSSVRMQSRRENGRLVLEAVVIPYQKNFEACRGNGRLMLTFAATAVDGFYQDVVYDESTEKQTANEAECEDGDNAEEEGIGWIIGREMENAEVASSSPNIDCICKHGIPKIAIMMDNADALHKLVFCKGIDDSVPSKLPQSLPPVIRSRMANALNVHEYLLRSNPRATTFRGVTSYSELTPPTLENHQNNEENVISCEDHVFERNDRREGQFLFKDYNKSMEDCWVSVMKNSRRGSVFSPGATFHCRVMT